MKYNKQKNMIVCLIALSFLILAHTLFLSDEIVTGTIFKPGQDQPLFLQPKQIYVDDDAPSDPGPNDPLVSDPLEDGSERHPYDEIQEALIASEDEDTIYVFNGIYYGNDFFQDPMPFIINKTINLVGENKYSTILDGSSFGNVVYINADRVHISGFTIQNGGTYFSNTAGIFIQSSDYCVISDNIIKENSIGIHIGIDSTQNDYMLGGSDNNIIENNDIFDNYEYGIYLNSYVEYCPCSGRYIGTTCNNNRIAYNDINNNGNGIYLLSVDGSDITDSKGEIQNISTTTYNFIFFNEISYNIDEGIVIRSQNILSSCNNNAIVLNDIENNGDNGLRIHGLDGGQCNNTYVHLNTISFNELNGIFLENNCNENTINKNNIFENGQTGIRLYYGNKNIISNNSIINNGLGSGIHPGIYLSYVKYQNIIGNQISENEIGIKLTGDSSDICERNTVKNNLIQNNEGNGIEIYSNYVINNDFIENIFESNLEYGISIKNSGSNNNHIYHNNFIGNNGGNIQAVDWANNFWDDGYPSGGNYWDDFDESSEGAFDNNGDGLIDSSYAIGEGTSQDNYPLAFQYI